jgi:hypothetical protein
LRERAEQSRQVTLGGYVDLGRNLAAVVERLANANIPTPLRALRGNHEETLLKFLANPEAKTNRINVDTCAVIASALTILALEREAVRYLTASGRPSAVGRA